MTSGLKRVWSRATNSDDEGASAVEYGLLVALIAVVIAAAVIALGGVLNDKFSNACEAVANDSSTSSTCGSN